MAGKLSKTITKVEAKQLDLFAPVEAHAERIDKAKVGMVKSALLIGAELSKAQEKLSKNKTGIFKRWVEERCGLSFRTGCNMMNAASVFGRNGKKFSPYISDSSMYLLAAPSTPREALDAAIERAGAGEKITHKLAKEIVAEFKPEPPTKAFVLETAENELVDRVHAMLDKWPKQHLDRAKHWLSQIAKGVA